MSRFVEPSSRRLFLGTLTSTFALGAAAFTTPGVFAEELELTKTPKQTEGPFYPPKLPLDTDNDLILINDSLTPAVGEIAYVYVIADACAIPGFVIISKNGQLFNFPNRSLSNNRHKIVRSVCWQFSYFSTNVRANGIEVA